MGNRMQNNYNEMKHPTGSLKESVDILRNSIKDLYELDEDNYQMIKNLQRAMDETNNRVNAVGRKSSGRIGRLAFGGLILTGLMCLGVREIRECNLKIRDLRIKIQALQPDEKAEESDG